MEGLRCDGAACVNLKEACHPHSHKVCSYSLCTLGHSAHLHDRIGHFFQEWAPLLTKADLILVEGQPPRSAGYPFELLLRNQAAWAHKCVFVAPQTLLAHFGTAKFSYEDRKTKNEERASKWLTAIGCEDLWTSICQERRQHDCADAILLILYHLESTRRPKPTLLESTTKIPTQLVSRFFAPPSSTPSKPRRPMDLGLTSAIASVKRNKQDQEPKDFNAFLEDFRYKQ